MDVCIYKYNNIENDKYIYLSLGQADKHKLAIYLMQKNISLSASQRGQILTKEMKCYQNADIEENFY